MIVRLFSLFSLLIAQDSYSLVLNNPLKPVKSKWRSTQVANFDEVDLEEKPKWAAGGVVSDMVNMLINSPLYTVMKPMARQTLIKTAEKNGIPWVERREALKAEQRELEMYYDRIEADIQEYPDYYKQPFHAYDEGNLCWDAAFECESATLSMALRVWPEENLTPLEAQQRLRSSFLDTVKSYLGPEMQSSPTLRIIDVGCSVGVSTHYLANAFPNASSIIGFDLSPHFLSVAMKRQKDASNINYDKIDWCHGNAENPPQEWTAATGQFDLTAASFLFHELPTEPTKNILRKMISITRSGGVIAITDNNPRSEVIMNLPAPIFTLMKSTEPHSDDYYQFGLEMALVDLGCFDVRTVPTDPRHRTILARVP